MELTNVLKLLWRRRFVVGVGAVIAVLAGAAASGVLPIRPAAGDAEVTGEALARVLVDTPDPLAGTVQPTGADTIQLRAVLLADLMTSDRVKALVAKRAGLEASEVVALKLADGEPTVPGELPERAATVATTVATERYVLDVRIDAAVPIISIGASAPDALSARRLAEEAVDAMRSVTARPSGRKGGVEIQPLGMVRAREVAGESDPRVRVGLAAAMVVFAMWCGAIVVASGLGRMWRSAGVRAADAVR